MTALHRFAQWLHDRGSAKLVRRAGLPYLERFYLLFLRAGQFTWKLFLHVFYKDDPDPLHCHPWDWGRVILRGWYREHYHDGTSCVFGPGHVVWRRNAEVLHRVELLTPVVVTLFWHWRRRRTWGFMYPDGWRPAPHQDQDGRRMTGIVLPRKHGQGPK